MEREGEEEAEVREKRREKRRGNYRRGRISILKLFIVYSTASP